MDLLELSGPFELTPDTIHSLENLIGCAVYVLGRPLSGQAFVPLRVGHTGTDISVHLQQYRRHYQTFYYSSCNSQEEAYATVCVLYHNLMPRDNLTHPVRPNGHPTACPVCGKEEVLRKSLRESLVDADATAAE